MGLYILDHCKLVCLSHQCIRTSLASGSVCVRMLPGCIRSASSTCDLLVPDCLFPTLPKLVLAPSLCCLCFGCIALLLIHVWVSIILDLDNSLLHQVSHPMPFDCNVLKDHHEYGSTRGILTMGSVARVRYGTISPVTYLPLFVVVAIALGTR